MSRGCDDKGLQAFLYRTFFLFYKLHMLYIYPPPPPPHCHPAAPQVLYIYSCISINVVCWLGLRGMDACVLFFLLFCLLVLFVMNENAKIYRYFLVYTHTKHTTYQILLGFCFRIIH